ncbi:MAG: hypothetical protein ACXVYB_16935 [Arthrobacter sp.]
MAHAENEIAIDRPAPEVYAFLADGLNNPGWRRRVQSIALRSGAPGEAGAVYSQTLTGPGGKSIQGDYRSTAAPWPSRSLPAGAPRRPVPAYGSPVPHHGPFRPGPQALGRDESLRRAHHQDDAGRNQPASGPETVIEED